MAMVVRASFRRRRLRGVGRTVQSHRSVHRPERTATTIVTSGNGLAEIVEEEPHRATEIANDEIVEAVAGEVDGERTVPIVIVRDTSSFFASNKFAVDTLKKELSG